MRLTLPDPKIDIGKDGFEKCHLNRAETGKHLSRLVDSIEDPMVIALDGSWGSGKSHFLKLWTGAHVNENGGKAKTIYFDAFEHDFLDDPLISLISKLSEKPETPGKFKKLKATGMKLLKPAARTTLAAATYGGTELVGALGDAILNKAASELETLSEAFWEKEASRTAAMQEFKAALRELTEPDDDGKPTQKIVIIIDELDRCRPDYALNMLEIMKHFFAVDGIHFVLGVNMKELENSVKARYGAGIDAARYLQKFVHLQLSLPIISGVSHTTASKFYELAIEGTTYAQRDLHQRIIELLVFMPERHQPSLRDIQRIIVSVAICPDEQLKNEFRKTALAMMTIMEIANPRLLRQALTGEANSQRFLDYFGLSEQDSSQFPDNSRGCPYWIIKITQRSTTSLSTQVSEAIKGSGLHPSEIGPSSQFLPDIYDKTLATFTLHN